MKSWLRSQIAQHTWDNFKSHFRDEHDILKVTTDRTLRDSRLHQANMVQQVVNGVTSTLLASQEPEPQAYEPEPQTHAANAIQHSNDLLPSLIQQMQQMQLMMMEIQRSNVK